VDPSCRWSWCRCRRWSPRYSRHSCLRCSCASMGAAGVSRSESAGERARRPAMTAACAPVPRQHGGLPMLKQRWRWLTAVVLGAFGLLFLRLWSLQITHGETYLPKSQDNFVKDLEIPALRGRIKDRRGRILVENRPAYNVYVTPRFFTAESARRLATLLELSEEAHTALWRKAQAPRGLGRFRGVLVREDVSRDVMALLETQRHELPGVAVEAVPHRSYPHGTLAAHVLGFLK